MVASDSEIIYYRGSGTLIRDFLGRLVKGDSLWVEYRGEKLPIDFIFGTPRKQANRGFPVYTVSFNLSN